MTRKINNNNSVELINQFLEEKDFFKEYDDDEIQKIKNNVKMTLYKQNFITLKELNMENSDDFVNFFYVKNDQEIESLISEIRNQKNINDKDQFNFYYIVIIVENYKMKLEVEKWKQEIRGLIKKEFECKSVTRVIYQIIQDVQNVSKEFDVRIDSRLSSITVPFDNNVQNHNSKSIASKVSSYVFTANLYDIANMYNYIGDALFDQNVRYKLKDSFDVEKNILSTLSNSPEDFWYLNNGVTMIVSSKDNINLFNPNKVVLSFNKFGNISIINGAQTISTAANYFFDNSKLKDELDYAQKNAKVLLRVMYVNDPNTDCKNYLNKISVSLNRQKPISVEDIAYTSERIFEINQLYKDNRDQYHFYISKRGEETIKKYAYSIPTLLRNYVAYYQQKPGDARSKSSKNIIDSVLNDELKYEIDEIEFNKRFKPINFVVGLGSLYDKFSNSHQYNIENKNTILKNGKYYFLSLVIYALILKDTKPFNENHYDFSDFKYTNDSYGENIDEIIEVYVDAINEHCQNTRLDSNDFKNQKLYSVIKNYEENKCLFDKINEFFS